MAEYDLVIGNGDVVLPGSGMTVCDVAVRDGRIVAIGKGIGGERAGRYIEARDRVVLPGAVDAHSHIGIYRPVAEDARSESASALVGGVTTMLSYFRTGANYLNTTGPYREVFPRMLEASSGNFFTDYGYHVAPMTHSHVEEIAALVEGFGVSTFKFYTFYKTLNLAGSGASREYIKSEDAYDSGHLYRIMRAIASLRQRYGRSVRLSTHCEDPEIIRVFMEETKGKGEGGLAAYSAARPPLAEAAAITHVAMLASETGCPINFLHLSSREAVQTAEASRHIMGGLDATIEVTLHHLALDYGRADAVLGKVNPPIRSKEDTEALWEAVAEGVVDVVVSDHACTTKAGKGTEMWTADPGFGGTALLVPLMVSEGFFKRNISLERVAQLISFNPARVHGLAPRKGAIAPGYDGDLAIVDMNEEKVVTPAALHSAQDFTPFEGLRVRGWPSHTIVRGQMALEDGQVVAQPGLGDYIRRPVGAQR
ncbi:MAG: dihydroorotase family protein [Chloroflexi bacterium]|nr:dihydroorotase family protein [Chloroflexota bacterium]